METLFLKFGVQSLTTLFNLGKGSYESISEVRTKLKTLRRSLDSVKEKYNLPKDEEQLARAIEDLKYDEFDLIDEIDIAASKFEASNNLPKKIWKKSDMDEMQADLEALRRDLDSSYFEILNKSQKDMTLQDTTFEENGLEVRGRETEQESITNLVNASCADILSIIPIVGMIGIGKTKLAQWAYHNAAADSDTFGVKMWVHVGQSIDVTELTRSMIEAANAHAKVYNESTSHLLTLNALRGKLKGILEKKKCLLVLDDVWHENTATLDKLLEPLKLKGGPERSKIIVTTRSTALAKSMGGTAGAICLKPLSDEDCWSILKDQVPNESQVSIDNDLEDIGMKIAKKCKGFPLGAVSVGKLLSQNINKDAWKNILKTQILSDHNEAVEALRSTFCDHLPSHLKDCFAYCSIFPQSNDLEKDILAGMWIGEGFIHPTEDKLLQDKPLEQLFSMTIFELVVGNGVYKMNQAVQDLALVVYGKRFFRMEKKSEASINPYTRYLSLNSDKFQTKMFEKFKGLRTFLLFHTLKSGEVGSLFFKTLTRLRVLDLSNSNLVTLAPDIGNLKHLRFLDLSNNPLKLLPNEIGKLVLLQTLRLVDCRELFKLPESISKLARLQHLQLGSDSRLTEMPSGIGKLRTLQTLGKFIVGTKSGEIKELKHMNNIRGSLCIQQLDKVPNPADAREANLAAKDIQELELQWSSAVRGRGDLKYESVLVHLQAGHTVKSLTVRHYAGRYFPNWVSDENFNFTSIFLKDCRFCTALPPFGQLPYLKSLRIEGMEELNKVDQDFCGKADQGFKKLETLELRRLPKLIQWSELRDTDMKNLNKLVIANCPEMNTLPMLHNLRSLEKLEFVSCPKIPSLPNLSSSVKNLAIADCAILKKRCDQNGGEDWAKIKDIPEKDIY